MNKTLINQVNAITTHSELRALIVLVNAKKKDLQQETKSQFSVGDSVYFLDRGMKVTGRIIKIMPKNIKVLTENNSWKVSPSLLRAA
jgi:hypothetical protein|tara:strand:+ start:264 stop:524 length:261 start_codon:yes stop_codon:yes gene_type:complete